MLRLSSTRKDHAMTRAPGALVTGASIKPAPAAPSTPPHVAWALWEAVTAESGHPTPAVQRLSAMTAETFEPPALRGVVKSAPERRGAARTSLGVRRVCRRRDHPRHTRPVGGRAEDAARRFLTADTRMWERFELVLRETRASDCRPRTRRSRRCSLWRGSLWRGTTLATRSSRAPRSRCCSAARTATHSTALRPASGT